MYRGSFKKNYNKIQEEASLWIAVYKVICNIVTLFVLPTVGTLSDVFGRHQAMFLIPVSLIFRSSFMMLILKDGKSFDTWLLLIAGPLPALVGGVSGLMVFATAYISDITPHDQRTLRITLIDAFSVMAAFTATLMSGFIIESLGYFGVYAGVLCLMMLAMINWFCFIKPIKNPSGGCSTRPPSTAKIESRFAHVESPARLSLICSSNYMLSDMRVDKLIPVKTSSPLNGIKEEVEAGLTKPWADKKGENETWEVVSYISEEEYASDVDGGIENGAKMITKFRSSEKGQVHGDENLKCHKTPTEKSKNTKDSEENGLSSRTCKAEKHPKERKATVQNEMSINNSNIGSNRKEFIKRLKDAANPFKNFLRIIRAVKGTEKIRLKIALLTVSALATFSQTGELNVIIIFLRSQPFYLMPRQIGFLIAFQNGALAVIGLMLCNTIFQRFCKIDDLVMILVSSSLSIVYFAAMALAKSTAVLYAIQLLTAVCYLNLPTIRAFLSKTSSPSTLGAVIGLIGTVESFSSVIACFVAPIVYSRLAATSTGTVHYIFALCMVVATIIIIVLNFTYPAKTRAKKLRVSIVKRRKEEDQESSLAGDDNGSCIPSEVSNKN